MTTIREGDRVEVVAPHPEAGARGIVERLFRANVDYERRARVRFAPPYGQGSEIIGLRMLEALPPPTPTRAHELRAFDDRRRSTWRRSAGPHSAGVDERRSGEERRTR